VDKRLAAAMPGLRLADEALWYAYTTLIRPYPPVDQISKPDTETQNTAPNHWHKTSELREQRVRMIARGSKGHLRFQ
jgi:hypothetical protein